MALLHEILAVEKSVEAAANILMEESKKTLKKESLFTGQTRSLSMFSEEDKHLDVQEHQRLESTVLENINYLIPYVAKFWDTSLSKDIGNQLAYANIELPNNVLMDNVPVTFLLGLETKLSKFRKVITEIPTLSPGIDWIRDEQEREGVYKSKNDIIQFKTEKIVNFKTIVEPTEHHPAQVQQVNSTKDVGRYTTKKQSGMMSPIDKAAILSRLDGVIQVVKKARMRANCEKVEVKKESQRILEYIING